MSDLVCLVCTQDWRRPPWVAKCVCVKACSWPTCKGLPGGKFVSTVTP